MWWPLMLCLLLLQILTKANHAVQDVIWWCHSLHTILVHLWRNYVQSSQGKTYHHAYGARRKKLKDMEIGNLECVINGWYWRLCWNCKQKTNRRRQKCWFDSWRNEEVHIRYKWLGYKKQNDLEVKHYNVAGAIVTTNQQMIKTIKMIREENV